MSDVEVDPFDFINGDDTDPASVESFEEVIDENVEIEQSEPGDDIPELETESAKPIIKSVTTKPIVLTPTGTPTFAEMARSRPSSECVPDEPAIFEEAVLDEPAIVEEIVEDPEVEEIAEDPEVEEIAEDPEVEDVVVEDVIETAPEVKVEAKAPNVEPTPIPAAPAAEGDAADASGSKQSRAERKTKKAMQKLGLTQVEGINRVVLRKDKSLLFVVPNPEVFKRGDTWVVLGEARVEDPNQRAREVAAQNMAEKVQKEKPDKIPQTITEEEEEEEDVSAEGIEEKDIELVMQQAACSKARAITALKNNQNDIVNAIMELTV